MWWRDRWLHSNSAHIIPLTFLAAIQNENTILYTVIVCLVIASDWKTKRNKLTVPKKKKTDNVLNRSPCTVDDDDLFWQKMIDSCRNGTGN